VRIRLDIELPEHGPALVKELHDLFDHVIASCIVRGVSPWRLVNLMDYYSVLLAKYSRDPGMVVELKRLWEIESLVP